MTDKPNYPIFDSLNRGEWLYGSVAELPEVGKALEHCADLCHHLNMTRPSQHTERREILELLLGSVGQRAIIHSPFRCDFGFNIHIGDNFVGNFNLSILDEAEVHIGHDVLIGPNCSLVTITHAMDSGQRRAGVMAARPITIGDRVWIASNVVILPGVSIGADTVIGAGSVVTHDIPSAVLAVGTPCRVVRQITAADRVSLDCY